MPRISPISASTLYPTPRLPNFPNPDRSRRIWVELTCVKSASSCELIVSLPILRACVNTIRYRDRRAATPRPSFSAGCCSSSSSLDIEASTLLREVNTSLPQAPLELVLVHEQLERLNTI